MKRIAYIIMMLCYALMCADLFIGIYPITFINIFSPPHLYIAWFALPIDVLFYACIIGILLFTTLAHFYKGSFKIIAVICLNIMAIGNILVIFDGPTFLLCIILIALTFYVAKEDEYIIADSTEPAPKPDKKKKYKILIIVAVSVVLLATSLLVNVEMYKNSRLEYEKQAFYEIKADYELVTENILEYIEKTQYGEPYCVNVYEKDGKIVLMQAGPDEYYEMEVDISVYESLQRIETSYSDLGYSLWCIRIDNNAVCFDTEIGYAIVYSIDDATLEEKGMNVSYYGEKYICKKLEDNWYHRNTWRHAR